MCYELVETIHARGNGGDQQGHPAGSDRIVRKQETILFLPAAPSYDGNPFSRRGMPIQYDAHVQIPETIRVLAAEGLDPDLACSLSRVSEFVHAALLRNGAGR